MKRLGSDPYSAMAASASRSTAAAIYAAKAASDSGGSGIVNADTLDGLNSTEFAQLAATQEFTGQNTFSTNQMQLTASPSCALWSNELTANANATLNLTATGTSASINNIEMPNGHAGIDLKKNMAGPTVSHYRISNSGLVLITKGTAHTYAGKGLQIGDSSNSLATSIYGSLQVGDIANGDYVNIDATDGHLTFAGNATYWDDLLIPALSTRGPAVGAPSLVAYKTTLAVLSFDKAADNSVHFSVQLPHRWKEGSLIYPHVHWMPKSSDVATKKYCMWALEYTWANHEAVFGASATVYGNVTTTNEMHVADKHYITKLKDGSGNAYIDGTGKAMSSILICRLYRDADGTLGTDDYDDEAYLLSVDFHIECDSLGSNAEYTKA